VFNSKIWGGGNSVGVARVAFTSVVLSSSPCPVDIGVAELGLETSNCSVAGLVTRFGKTGRELGVKRLVPALAAGRYVGFVEVSVCAAFLAEDASKAAVPPGDPVLQATLFGAETVSSNV
jgi:hypothetical protein